MEIIRKIVSVITITWLVYFAVCYGDILSHNLDYHPNYENHGWNILVTLWYTDKKSPEH